MVFVSGERATVSEALVLPESSGLVLGTLFSRANECAGEPSGAIGRDDREKIATQGAATLLKEYWGRYVALLRAPSGELAVLREPSGALPAFHTVYRRLDIVFSDVDCLVRDLDLNFTINWPYVEAYVAFPYLTCEDTGLEEVVEILPGRCLPLTGNNTSGAVLWHPFQDRAFDSEPHLDDAAQLAQRTLRHCVGSWARQFPSVLHRLSGGLDSSVVLACLAASEPGTRTTCLNYFGSGMQEDERFYARLVCQHLGVDLIEYRNQGQALRLARPQEMPYAVRPCQYFYYLEHVPLATRVARECGAQSVFDGAGGDALFFQTPGAMAVVDRLRMGRSRDDIWRVALDAAQIEKKTVWRVLREARQIRRGRFKHPISDEYLEYRPYIPRAVIEKFETSARFAHPWADVAKAASPGKRFHVFSNSFSGLPGYEPFSSVDSPDPIHPIISQPVLELFYALPLATLIQGGWDRAVVRDAFAKYLPAQVIRRRGKGAATATLKQTFEANRREISQIMLDGNLASRGLLDRQALLNTFASGTKDPSFTPLVIDYLPMELWLQKWMRSANAGLDVRSGT